MTKREKLLNLFGFLMDLLEEDKVDGYTPTINPETHKRSRDIMAKMDDIDNNKASDLAGKAIVKKWWAFMKDIMESNEDNSPVAKDLQLVFYQP